MAEPTKQRVPSIADVVRDGVDLFDELADVIANPPANKPLRGAISRSGRAMCDFYGATPVAARSVFGTSSPVIGLLCEPYFDSSGYDGPVPGPPPFTGGQCAGASYGANYQYFDSPSSVTPTTYTAASGQFGGQDIYGPITSAGFVVNDGQFCGGGQNAFIITGKSSTGTTKRVAINLGGSPCRGVGVRVEGLSFVKLAGGAECGNIPTAPVPGTNPPPSPGPFPPGFGPGVDPDGSPFFFVPPIDPEYPGDEPTEVPVFGPTGQPTSGPPAGGGDAGAPSDTGLGGDAEDEAEPGDMLWGLRVGILSAPPNARQYAPGVYRGVAYIYMGDADGLDHDPAGAMLQDGQFVLAERDYLTKWRVAANPGYNLRVTPYYKSTGE